MLRIIAFALAASAAVTLSSCASETYLPDGRKGYTISCDGMLLNWGTCLKKAGDICRERGYDVYMRSAATGQLTIVSADTYTGSGFSGPMFQREIMIGCRG